MRRIASAFVLVLAVIAAAPGAAFAQTTGIAGVVRDTTGAVMPGVTVEASSPALIEQLRTVTTDTQGQYKIVDLRPGTYSVTFTLPGFSTVKREGIELVAMFTATVSVELRVGALEETVTVSGAGVNEPFQAYPGSLYILESHATNSYSWPSGDGSVVFGHADLTPISLASPFVAAAMHPPQGGEQVFTR